MSGRQSRTVAREATPSDSDRRAACDTREFSATVDLRDAPIEGIAKLLAAIARPCECEVGERREDCAGAPIDRWEREWAANL